MFTLQDYIEEIGLKKNKAELLHNVINENKIISFHQLSELHGFGEKSLEKVYNFAINGPVNNQLNLFN